MQMKGARYAIALATVIASACFASDGRGPVEPLGEILGVTVGMPEAEARVLLTPLGETAGRDTRSGGRKQGFILRESRYAWIAYKAGKSGDLKWVSANLRAGEEIAFAELGDLATADSANDFQVIWNVARGNSGYRLVAKGAGGKAQVVYLLALD